jgi:signal transduction histidine kinase
MLAFSRRQPLQAKDVDVNALIGGTTRLLSRALGGNITVAVRTGIDLPAVLVDASQLETALLNIAINARDAMPDGGTLTLGTRVAELDADYAARHPGVRPGTYVAIEITDTGTGIPPDLIERIFDPFFTTKPSGRGTGLGLSMVYGFINSPAGTSRSTVRLARAPHSCCCCRLPWRRIEKRSPRHPALRSAPAMR